MSKRGEADYITKDGKGSMSAPQEGVPRTATAAQMAQRKLKAPRGRLHGGISSTSSSSFSSGSAPNLFGQIGAGNNQFSTSFGSNNNTGVTNFSISASFPPSTASNVNFAPTPPSGAFTFAPQTASNPFSGLGNNTEDNGANSISFGGFGTPINGTANSQPDGDTMMESPQKKPSAFGAIFGTGNMATPSSAPFSFGQSSQSVATSGFGASAAGQPPNNTFKFGQSQPAAQPGNLFNFGAQKVEEPKTQTLFGQATNSSQPAANLFGQTTSAPSSSSPLFSQSNSAFNPSSNPFGQTQATSTSTVNIFGSSAPTTQPSNGGSFNKLFGQVPAATTPPAISQTFSEVSKPVFSFTPSTSQPTFSFSAGPASASNITSSNLTPQAPDLSTASSGLESAVPISSEGSSRTAFGDIFKPNANADLASPDASAMSVENTSAKSNSSTFELNSSSSKPSFSSDGGLLSSKLSESNAGGELFGRATHPEEPASTKAALVTSQNPIEDERELNTTNSNGANTTGLFGKASKLEQTPGPAVEPVKPQGTPSQPFKGFQSQLSTQQPTSSSSGFGNLFGTSTNKNSSAAHQKTPSNSSSDSSLFTRASAPSFHNASSKPAESQPKHSWPVKGPTPLPAKPSSASMLTSSTSFKIPAAPQSTPATSKGTVSTTSESGVRLRSYGSSSIPGYLDSDESVEHDSLSRLRNLNSSFQKIITKLDPGADDFEEIVRHYVAQRARIGRSLNLKERNRAGMKRKKDNSEANEEPANTSKKARPDDFSSESTNLRIPPTITGTNATSAAVEPHSNVAAQSPPPHTASDLNSNSSSATSNIFKHMISSPTPASSTFPSKSSTSYPSSSAFASLEASVLSSSTVTSRAEATASGTAKDSVQLANPPSSINAASANSGVLSASSPAPLFKAQLPSTTPTKSPTKKPDFEVPRFGPSSGTSFMDAFAKQSAKSAEQLQEEAKRKRKAEDFDSDEDDEAEWERKYAEEERAKRNKLESLSKAGLSGFQPLFGDKDASATAKTFFNLANSKTSEVSPAPQKEPSANSSVGFDSDGASGKTSEEPVNTSSEESDRSRSSEEHGESASQGEDSGEGSEEGNGTDEEYVSEGTHDQEQDDEDSTEQAPESDDEDIQSAMTRSRSKGSLFDRIEPNPNLRLNETFNSGARNAPKKSNSISSTSLEVKNTSNNPEAAQAATNNSFKPLGANGVLNPGTPASTPSASTISPFKPINGIGSGAKDPFAPAGSIFVNSRKSDIDDGSSSKKINGDKLSSTSNTSVSAQSPAKSVLFGGNTSLSSGVIPGEGLFGSRPSTPSNDEPLREGVFGNLGSGPNFSNSQGDHTYKRGTPLKFGNPNNEGPIVNITAATPPAKDDSSASSKSFPNLFGPKPSKPGGDAVASVGFNFGMPTHLTASPLLGTSALSSVVSSRATSPGATDTESVNTDAAEDHSDEPQTSLMSSRPGEENEEVLFEARSKALKYITDEVAKEKRLDSGFNTQGVGQLRVLKHRISGKTRLLLRAEPGSNIVINTALSPSMTYKATETKGSGAVKFGIPTATGIDLWVAKVKTAAMAEELAGILEANKVEAVQN